MGFAQNVAVRSLLFAALIAAGAPRAWTQETRVVSAADLRSQVIEAMKAGNFSRTSDLLNEISGSKDPLLTKMADWALQFEKQRQGFAAERQKEFDKQVASVRLLLDKKKDSYAIDYLSRAYDLSMDKKTFRAEAWVDGLVKWAISQAQQYEKDEQWFKAMRIYSDLGVIEPFKPEWKEHLKTATRRMRLLAVYAHEMFKQQQEAEARDREEVDVLLKGSAVKTRPATQPEENGNFRTDWRDMVKGIKPSMLRAALEQAVDNYYRDITYKQVAVGGLKGLRVLLTTPGLEKSFSGMADAANKKAFVKELDDQLEKINGARIDVARRTVEDMLDKLAEVNQETVKLPEEVLVSEFADGAFSELDQFSNIIWPYDLEEFQKTVKGEFSGVGIQIQSDEDGSLRVVSPLEDSPAFKAGIKAGDIISHINGKVAKGISLTQAVKQITGPPHTTVTLTIRSTDGASRDVALVRETIRVQSVKGWLHKPGGGWDYMIDQQNKIAYLRLTNFTATSMDELDKALDEMENGGVKGMILDLRYNPGGLLSAATEISDKFIDKGVIVSTRPDRQTAHARTRADADPLKAKWKLPLVVLVNQYSASASEIVSGALKDHRRALIVGERTFGKGSVQMLFPLDNKRAYLKLTTSHYYLPSDKCIHREENSTEWGVDPDVKIEMTPEQMRAAIDSRQDQDVLREAREDGHPVINKGPATTQKARDPLSADAQLSGALLLLRLQVTGA